MTENKAINSQTISECKGKTNTKGTSFMEKWRYTIFLFIGNTAIYAVAFRVFSAQNLQFLLLSIAFVIVNDLYIVLENNKAYKEVSAAVVKMSTEIRLYEAIGTVEECQEAMKRQTGKIPKLYGDYEDGRLLCPNCDENLMDLAECGFDYCPYCGQKLDWSE